MKNNIFNDLPDQLPEEIFEDILVKSNLRIERIVSKGHSTPKDEWLCQEQNEWIILLEGNAKLVFNNEDKVIELAPGDYINIPAGQTHRVESTLEDKPSIWLAIHY